ncbi:MAG: DUF47 domain-containing protein [Acidobacteriota bacterium]
MGLFGKKDEKLFKLFVESARVVVRGGDILVSVAEDYRDLDTKMANLTEMEHEGDKIIQQLVEKLNSSFVLPFDREDAFELVQKLDATLDYITGIVDRMILYKTGAPNQTVRDMVQILYQALKEQEAAFAMLENLESKKGSIMKCAETIRNLEKKQDSLYRTSMAALFEKETDPIKIIKWKEVYENIETATDYLEDVGDLLSNLCIKYS